MNSYSRDMFEEMDDMFARIFTRMQQEMMTGDPAVSGYRIIIEGHGIPRGEPDLPRADPRITNTPVTEVHRIDDEVKVITELPGALVESIHLDIQEKKLTIDAGDAEMPYHTTADLPPVDTGSMQQSFRNGVLEVTFRLLPEPAQQ